MSALAYRHQRVQRLRRLVARRSARTEEGRFVIEGLNLLEEALAAGAAIEAVFVDLDSRDAAETGTAAGEQSAGPGAQRLARLLKDCYDRGARVFDLQHGVVERVAGTVAPQPVMAVVETPRRSMAEVHAANPRLVVVLVDVRDPGNAGTAARAAWAAGADAVICCEGTVDMWAPKAVRSSAGAVMHVPIVGARSPVEALNELGSLGLRRLAAVPSGGDDYSTVDLAAPCALVMGNEASGLPVSALASVLDGLISIPMPGGAGSLNVGTAVAVLCFEVARQRRRQGLTAAVR